MESLKIKLREMTRMVRPLLAIMLALGYTELQAAAIWEEVLSQGRDIENESRHYRVDADSLYAKLAQAPPEHRGDRSLIIELPMPDGRLASFAIVESPIMEAALAERYPDIKTYKLYGIDDPAATGRADVTPRGFKAMLQTPRGSLFIDPVPAMGAAVYRSLYRSGGRGQNFSCGVRQSGSGPLDPLDFPQRTSARLPGNYLTYRLAVAATEEYVAAVGGTVPAAQAEIITAINRVNQIYERDLGIRLLLVGNNDSLIENNGQECLSNNDSFAILSENQLWIDTLIGAGSYDIGHVFTTNGGGLARLQSVCDATHKSEGTTGLSNPTGDMFYIDYVAHEIGHQFGADHSFNATVGSCNFNRNASTAFEPGSGSTIMAYAGICGAENLQGNSDATFHAGSIGQIDTYTSGGGNCYTPLATGNSDPTLTGIVDRTIPGNTPFVLDNLSVTDADAGDVHAYQWDQLDTGTATNGTSFGQDLGDNSLFRSYPPQAHTYRDFPALGTQLQGFFDKAEAFACSDRFLNFQLTVRDNAGGQAIDNVRVTVDRDAGPFRIASFNTAQTIDTTAGPVTLTWDVANTDIPPINCANVDIDLLTFSDAGFTSFSVHSLVSATPNDGTEDIFVAAAANSHPRARLRVSCNSNIFYDISDADLNIQGSSAVLFNDSDIATFFNDLGITLSGFAPSCGVPRPSNDLAVANRQSGHDNDLTAAAIDVFAEDNPAGRYAAHECNFRNDSSYDSGSADLRWLLSLVLLVSLVKIVRRNTAGNRS